MKPRSKMFANISFNLFSKKSHFFFFIKLFWGRFWCRQMVTYVYFLQCRNIRLRPVLNVQSRRLYHVCVHSYFFVLCIFFVKCAILSRPLCRSINSISTSQQLGILESTYPFLSHPGNWNLFFMWVNTNLSFTPSRK